MRLMFIILMLSAAINLHAQSLKATGVLTYRQRIVMEHDTTAYAETMIELLFNEQMSVTRRKQESTYQGGTNTEQWVKNPFNPKRGAIYKDYIRQEVSSIEPAVTERIFLVDTMGRIDWKIYPDTRKFGTLTAQRAEGLVRGRHWTVWFAPSVPVSDGPWKLYGLPGLILEARERSGRFRFLFESLAIPPVTETLMESLTPEKGQKVLPKDKFIAQLKVNRDNYVKMKITDPRSPGGSLEVKLGGMEVYPGLD